ncbi:MAG: sigma-70 family RNA polymerase sigma factor [Deltaproteobacteria bacterium]|jgi:RNA polymerase sigma-70 factor (ECF subfamily)|nr:sigma-70 family RNA polymerase sigma factor [Deltaproteobacteria bacterium]MBW2535947.1 sigma-70 family RNA polymerase sigma factor [Deltaproteobacteria bacterium]
MAYLKPRRPADAGTRAPSFDEDVLSHLDALYGVAFRMTKDAAAAEDLVHDTVVKAIRARHQYQSGTNLKAWLLRILTNTFINRHRRGGLERDVLEGPDAGPLADRWTGAATMRGMRHPEREALAPLIQAEVQRALDTLPEHFRMVVLLSDVEGLSYKEIAEVMDTPIGTVMSRLHRARAMLQNLLKAHAVALGIVTDEDGDSADEQVTQRNAANGDTTPVSLTEYRTRKKGTPKDER